MILPPIKKELLLLSLDNLTKVSGKKLWKSTLCEIKNTEIIW